MASQPGERTPADGGEVVDPARRGHEAVVREQDHAACPETSGRLDVVERLPLRRQLAGVAIGAQQQQVTQLAHRALAFVRGEDVAVLELVDVAHLQVKALHLRGQRCDVHDLALRIHLDGLTRLLLGDERVAIREPLTAEDLVRLAHVIKHRLAARRDLAHARRLPAVAEHDVPVREHLEDDRRARRLELPHELSVRIEFDEAVRAFAVFGEKQTAFAFLRRGKAGDEQQGDDEEMACAFHGGCWS